MPYRPWKCCPRRGHVETIGRNLVRHTAEGVDADRAMAERGAHAVEAAADVRPGRVRHQPALPEGQALTACPQAHRALFRIADLHEAEAQIDGVPL